MMSCKEVSQIVYAGNLDSQSLGRRMQYKIHLLMCRHCRSFVAQMRRISQVVAESGKDTDEAALQRILNSLKSKL